MIWEQNVDVIAMVTLEREGGKVKCHRYWPETREHPLVFPSEWVWMLHPHIHLLVPFSWTLSLQFPLFFLHFVPSNYWCSHLSEYGCSTPLSEYGCSTPISTDFLLLAFVSSVSPIRSLISSCPPPPPLHPPLFSYFVPSNHSLPFDLTVFLLLGVLTSVSNFLPFSLHAPLFSSLVPSYHCLPFCLTVFLLLAFLPSVSPILYPFSSFPPSPALVFLSWPSSSFSFLPLTVSFLPIPPLGWPYPYKENNWVTFTLRESSAWGTSQ